MPANTTMGTRTTRDVSFALPGITLLGVESEIDPATGRRGRSYPMLGQLMKLILELMVRKPSKLAKEEIALLLDELELSQAAVAQRFGVHPSTVSNWMTGKKPMDDISERQLRLGLATTAGLPLSPIALKKPVQGQASTARCPPRIRRRPLEVCPSWRSPFCSWLAPGPATAWRHPSSPPPRPRTPTGDGKRQDRAAPAKPKAQGNAHPSSQVSEITVKSAAQQGAAVDRMRLRILEPNVVRHRARTQVRTRPEHPRLILPLSFKR